MTSGTLQKRRPGIRDSGTGGTDVTPLLHDGQKGCRHRAFGQYPNDIGPMREAREVDANGLVGSWRHSRHEKGMAEAPERSGR